MRTVHTVAELREQIAEWKRAGERVGLVPTMGNLHAGHLELVARARSLARRVVVSIFVNPLQFGPNEDFDRYPRTLPADAAKLDAAGCDLLFAPDVAQMYPQGRENLSTVSVPALNSLLDGEFRPGHFDGVATVVSILFNQVQPDLAVFGEKDWQQLQVVRRMVADLHLPLTIVGHPTARDTDGLALSSRNQYLSAEERALAPEIFRTLGGLSDSLKAGRRDFEALQREALQRLEGFGFKAQYVEIRAPDLSAATADGREWILLVAAFLGRTRLIDNRYLCL
ncbi:pantothenate synthetase [Panacagrimonas perspica]|uniref:Pantothenate synthetase n=1 Tax=Panacagrimonas perspica TaxID=381431 RepID=A0A4V3UR40_9GAMM|nr:pantoate--beta-alanine ligase [Panacagrimonas perspica]TDU24410.1 pantothenate synthetase [Panacagrimonas perspica]THD01451.1 pantoate--beta-alanine ligase [Panacagrimonas perspica]